MRRILALILLALLILPAGAIAQPAALPTPSRVLILGDSLAGGAHASNPAATYAARVAHALGSADYTLVRAQMRLEGAEQSWATFGPWAWDLVIVEVGINDSLTPTLPDNEWAARYAALTRAIVEANTRVVCVTPFDIGEPEIDLRARAALIRQSCAGGTVADVWGATAGRADLRAAPGTPTFYAGGRVNDPYHPTDEGHALIAQTILDALAGRVYLPGVNR